MQQKYLLCYICIRNWTHLKEDSFIEIPSFESFLSSYFVYFFRSSDSNPEKMFI